MSADELALLIEARLRGVVPVREPLLLVSQIQRSGGTLLSQLFDAHPEVHAHPDELKVGWPKKAKWPPLDLEDGPERWFEMLYEKSPARALAVGYRKHSRPDGADPSNQTFPFLFLPSLQRRLFLQEAENASSEREVFDAYFTSYFNAWLDNQSLYAQPKRVVTAFVPRMMTAADNRERFFATYPDGRLISIIRDPRSWWCSAREHKPHVYGDLDVAIAQWRESTMAASAALERWPDRVLILEYERLVADTVGVMREVASFAGIQFADVLTVPTFNGTPIKSNSTRPPEHGVLAWPATRHRQELSPVEAARIEELTAGLV